MLCKNHVRNGFENPFFRKSMGLKFMPGILSTNNPVSKVSGLRPSTFETGLLVLIYDHIIMDYHDYNGVIYKFTNLSLLILE